MGGAIVVRNLENCGRLANARRGILACAFNAEYGRRTLLVFDRIVHNGTGGSSPPGSARYSGNLCRNGRVSLLSSLFRIARAVVVFPRADGYDRSLVGYSGHTYSI